MPHTVLYVKTYFFTGKIFLQFLGQDKLEKATHTQLIGLHSSGKDNVMCLDTGIHYVWSNSATQSIRTNDEATAVCI